MKQGYNNVKQLLRQNRDDLEYLLFVGVPGGILMILLAEKLNFVNLF
jgi:hypothetical protein